MLLLTKFYSKQEICLTIPDQEKDFYQIANPGGGFTKNDN
jgi:hypothetical protein